MAVRHRAWPSAGRSASELASQRLSEGLPNQRGYSRVPPKFRKVPVNGVSQRRRPRPGRRTGVRLDCNRACPRAVGGLLFRADFRGLPQGHRSSSRQQRQMSTVAPAISVFEPPSRPSDPAAWPSASRSASPSASQRPPEGLPNPPVYSRLPPEKVPKGGVSLRRRPRPVRLDCNRACPRAVGGLLFRADYRARPQGHRSSSRQQRQQEHRRAGDLGIRPPPRPSGTAAWPSAGRSASESAPQRPPERLPNLRAYSRVPPEIRKGARRRRFLSVADATRFATPASLPPTPIRHRRSVGVVAPASASRPRFHRPHHRRCRFPSQPLQQATQERFRPQRRNHSELPSSGSSRPSD